MNEFSSPRGSNSVSPASSISFERHLSKTDHSEQDKELKMQTSEETIYDEIWEQFNWVRFKYYMENAWREMNKRKFQYALGFFSIFLVVVIAGTCFTLVARAPAIFLQSSEVSSGQFDITMSPVGTSTQCDSLNYTLIQLQLDAAPGVSSTVIASPRLLLAVTLYPKSCADQVSSSGVNATDVSWRYHGSDALRKNLFPECVSMGSDCLARICSSGVPNSISHIYLTLIDSDRERTAQIGRSWPLSQRIPAGSVVLGNEMASKLGVQTGDTVWTTVTFEEVLLNQLVKQSLHQLSPDMLSSYFRANESSVLNEFMNKFGSIVHIPFTVHAVLGNDVYANMK
jgi:hypothetical protein